MKPSARRRRVLIAAIASILLATGGLGTAPLLAVGSASAATTTSATTTTSSTSTTATSTSKPPAPPSDKTSTSDWVKIAVEGLVVIGFIALGVRSGGVGLGLWGGVGTLILVFVFGLDPGEPPIDAILIIITVISAAAAMQAAGGVDYMVQIASRALRARPSAPRQAERDQLRRALRLLRADDPHRHRQHVLLDHPGHQRGRLREQDPA